MAVEVCATHPAQPTRTISKTLHESTRKGRPLGARIYYLVNFNILLDCVEEVLLMGWNQWGLLQLSSKFVLMTTTDLNVMRNRYEEISAGYPTSEENWKPKLSSSCKAGQTISS